MNLPLLLQEMDAFSESFSGVNIEYQMRIASCAILTS
jgi:hypothetical protein